MADGDRWIRLNTTWSASEWLATLTPAQRLVWPEMLCYVKAHGTQGRCKRSIEPLRRVTGVTRDDVTTLEKAAQNDGALRIEDGDWIVTGWYKHQPSDPTAADRQRRSRKQRKHLPADANQRNNTGRHGTSHRDVTQTETVTGTATAADAAVGAAAASKASQVRERLTTQGQRAWDAMHPRIRNHDAFAHELEAIVTGLHHTHGPTPTWEAVSAALADMETNGAPATARVVRGYARKAVDTMRPLSGTAAERLFRDE
jgi:hypothetical protein